MTAATAPVSAGSLWSDLNQSSLENSPGMEIHSSFHCQDKPLVPSEPISSKTPELIVGSTSECNDPLADPIEVASKADETSAEAPPLKSCGKRKKSRVSKSGKSTEDSKKKCKPNKKRKRRVAAEIERKYKCKVAPNCTKAYGSEGALKMHIKLKHPEVKQASAKTNPQIQGYIAAYPHFPLQFLNLGQLPLPFTIPGLPQTQLFYPLPSTSVPGSSSDHPSSPVGGSNTLQLQHSSCLPQAPLQPQTQPPLSSFNPSGTPLVTVTAIPNHHLHHHHHQSLHPILPASQTGIPHTVLFSQLLSSQGTIELAGGDHQTTTTTTTTPGTNTIEKIYNHIANNIPSHSFNIPQCCEKIHNNNSNLVQDQSPADNVEGKGSRDHGSDKMTTQSPMLSSSVDAINENQSNSSNNANSNANNTYNDPVMMSMTSTSSTTTTDVNMHMHMNMNMNMHMDMDIDIDVLANLVNSNSPFLNFSSYDMASASSSPMSKCAEEMIIHNWNPLVPLQEDQVQYGGQEEEQEENPHEVPEDEAFHPDSFLL